MENEFKRSLKPRQLSEREVKEILNLAQKHKHNISEISKILKISYSDVVNVFNQYNINREVGDETPRGITLQTKMIMELAKTNKFTMKEIADKLEIPLKSVSDAVQRHKIKGIVRTNNRREVLQEIIRLAQTGEYSVEEISEITGQSIEKVERSLKTYNIKGLPQRNSTNHNQGKTIDTKIEISSDNHINKDGEELEL